MHSSVLKAVSYISSISIEKSELNTQNEEISGWLTPRGPQSECFYLFVGFVHIFKVKQVCMPYKVAKSEI